MSVRLKGKNILSDVLISSATHGCKVYFIHSIRETQGKCFFPPQKQLNINIILVSNTLFQSNDEANMFNTFKHFSKGGAFSQKSHFKRVPTSVALSTRLLKSIFDQGS